jgi:hypothetical protein
MLVFCTSLANHRVLAAALGASAGVMMVRDRGVPWKVDKTCFIRNAPHPQQISEHWTWSALLSVWFAVTGVVLCQ